MESFWSFVLVYKILTGRRLFRFYVTDIYNHLSQKFVLIVEDFWLDVQSVQGKKAFGEADLLLLWKSSASPEQSFRYRYYAGSIIFQGQLWHLKTIHRFLLFEFHPELKMPDWYTTYCYCPFLFLIVNKGLELFKFLRNNCYLKMSRF